MARTSRNAGARAVRAGIGAALVTGAARRIGRAIALSLAGRGHAVGLHCHASLADAHALAREIDAAGGRAAVLEADLADAQAAGGLIARCAHELGPVRVLVNNASLFAADGAPQIEVQSWQAHLAVNLTAPVLLACQFAQALPRGADGVIVNILDQRVVRPLPGFFSYGVAKAGLWAATQMLAQSLAPRVRVNGIGPGPTARSDHQSAAAFRAQQRALPLERGPAPEEIAAAVGFIIDQPAITGAILLVDGGQHLAWRTADAMLDNVPPSQAGEDRG